MGELSHEEAVRLGLEPAGQPKAELSHEEAVRLGLEPGGPKVPAGKVAGPRGWEPAGANHDPGMGDLHQLDRDLNREHTAMWGALASGAHGAAAAMEGPINGLIAAAKADVPNALSLHPDPTVPGNAYRKERNRIEAEQAQNLKDFPNAPVIGSVLAGGVGSAPSVAGRLLMSTGQGMAYGFGSSKADLTKGEWKPAFVDTAVGGGLGFGGGVFGEGLQAGARAVGNKLGGVLQRTEDAAAKTAQKTFASARGAYGGEVSSAARTLEVVEKAALDESLPEALRLQAKDFLAGPEAQALRQQVVKSTLGRGSDQLARIQSARDAMSNAGDALQPDAIKAAAQGRIDDPAALLRRLRDLVPKLAVPAIGAALGGPAGAAAGAVAAKAAGRPGTVIANMIQDPYVATRALGFGVGLMSGAGGAVARGAPAVGEEAGALPASEDPRFKRLMQYFDAMDGQ